MWDAPWHWVVIALLFAALFGYKRLPEMSRSVGKSLRIFRTEIKGMGEDDAARTEAAQAVAAPAVTAQAPAPLAAPAPSPVAVAPVAAPIVAAPIVAAPIVAQPAPVETPSAIVD